MKLHGGIDRLRVINLLKDTCRSFTFAILGAGVVAYFLFGGGLSVFFLSVISVGGLIFIVWVLYRLHRSDILTVENVVRVLHYQPECIEDVELLDRLAFIKKRVFFKFEYLQANIGSYRYWSRVYGFISSGTVASVSVQNKEITYKFIDGPGLCVSVDYPVFTDRARVVKAYNAILDFRKIYEKVADIPSDVIGFQHKIFKVGDVLYWPSVNSEFLYEKVLSIEIKADTVTYALAGDDGTTGTGWHNVPVEHIYKVRADAIVAHNAQLEALKEVVAE